MSSRTGAPAWLRWAAFGLGLAFFFWIPFEDTQPIVVILLGAATCGLLAAGAVRRWQRGGPVSLLRSVGAGLLAGLALAPLTVVLMAIKTGLHGHSVPDFTPEQIQAVLLLAPIWTLAGGMIGLGLGLFSRSISGMR